MSDEKADSNSEQSQQNEWSPQQTNNVENQTTTDCASPNNNQTQDGEIMKDGLSAEMSDVSSGGGERKSASSGGKSVKNEEKKIFIGGISWDTTDEDLKNFFGQFGEVAHVQIKYDHFTGRSRGFAFVEFANPDSCHEALQHKDREIKGKKCEVKPAKSRENKKIFVGGLPADFSEDELRKHFEQYGKLEEIEWPYDKFQNKRKNFAFIVFEDEDATQKAAQIQKQRFGDRMCDVKVAVPQYMRPQRQYGGTANSWGTGWNDYGNYGGYGGYGGGYGGNSGYYDDYYNNYDYSGGASGNYDYSGWQGGYEGWGYSAAPAATAGGGSSTTRGGGRNAYPNYGAY